MTERAVEAMARDLAETLFHDDELQALVREGSSAAVERAFRRIIAKHLRPPAQPASEREVGLERALRAARGYLMNAAIDLETRTPRRVALDTINGGLRVVDAALAKEPQHDE